MSSSIELLRRIWLGLLIGAIIGLGVGLFLGWVVWPTSWSLNADDVAVMGDAYRTSPTITATYAKTRLSGLSKEEQSRLFTQAIQSANSSGNSLQAGSVTLLAQAVGVNLGSAVTVPPSGATSVPPKAATSNTSLLAGNSILSIALLFAVLILLAAAALIFVLRILPQMRAGQGQAAKRAPAAVAPAGGGTSVTPVVPAPRAVAPSTAATTSAGGLGRFVASYSLGNDNYDTSFSLETVRQEFLGECGMGISETIGDGKPDKVTAFDLWLFDKADVRTVTQIVMSEYAYNDQSLRAKLAAKGEAILAEKGKVISLETQSLRLAAQIVDLQYATNPGLPANSHFAKLTVEIIPALKEAVPA
jgi:hypothetical protein